MTMNHVHLGTKNIRRAEDFYSRYFGFKKKCDHGNGVFLTDAAGFLIAIDPVDELPQLPEWYHLGFCVDDASKVHTIYGAMKQGAVNIVRDLKAVDGEFASFFC